MSEADRDKAPPKVFISYSHDSPAHKQWVGEFATKLRQNGIDVTLDQWDLGLGDDVPKFMEKSVSEADRVLMVCTETYVRKADDGTGGVGYEAMIVTAELVAQLSTSKFIPIVRQDSGQNLRPKSVATRLYVNLSVGADVEAGFKALLHELHNLPLLKKPALGPNPLLAPAPPDSDQVETLTNPSKPEQSWENAQAAYESALSIAKRGDLVDWRRLLRRIQRVIPTKLQEIRKQYVSQKSFHPNDLTNMVNLAADAHAPLFAVALGGVESGRDKFNRQAALLDELLNPREWEANGPNFLNAVPEAMAFTYQALHGATCIETQQLGLAIEMAKTSVRLRNESRTEPLFVSPVVGWPESFDTRCNLAWDYLHKLGERWHWLEEIFGSAEAYKESIGAYYLALNILELAHMLAGKQEEVLKGDDYRLEVPFCVQRLPRDSRERSYQRLIRDPQAIQRIWDDLGVSTAAIRSNWDRWMLLVRTWYVRAFGNGSWNQPPHTGLFNDVLFK